MAADDNDLHDELFPHFRVMVVSDVTVPLPKTHALVFLTENEAPHRTLGIPVGLTDGAAIVSARERARGLRPSTHELLADVLARVNVDVIALRIVGESAGVFRGELDLMTPRGREIVDCRPSDGIVLALRQAVPAPLLLDEALLHPEA